MPDLDEEDGEVVDEDEGGGEAVRELHDVVVRHSPPLFSRNDLEAEKIQVRIRMYKVGQ